MGSLSSLKYEDLKPGDVIIYDGHACMFCGVDIIKQIHGDKAKEGSDMGQASLGDHTPSCSAGGH